MNFNWADIIKLAISTGIITALINQGIIWYKERVNYAKLEQFSALRIIVQLEKFVLDCIEKISEDDVYDQTDGQMGKFHMEIPMLDSYSSDIEWKLMDVSLCLSILSLPNEIKVSQHVINGWFDVDGSSVSLKFREETGKCAYRAWQISKKLRKIYGSKAFNSMIVDEDIVEILKKYHDKAYAG